MRYSHRLSGHGPAEEWTEFRPGNSVSYRGLPAGEYRFEVRTQDPEGVISEVARMQVRVVPGPQGRTPSDSGPGAPHPG